MVSAARARQSLHLLFSTADASLYSVPTKIQRIFGMLQRSFCVIPSVPYVIPNECEGSPRKGQRAEGASLTLPRWGSCAASSKCSCKQAFLLASDGMTEERGCALTPSLWARAPIRRSAPAGGAFLLLSDEMAGKGKRGALPYKMTKRYSPRIRRIG